MSMISETSFKRIHQQMVDSPKRQKTREEDFRFMVVCAAKDNMAMYHLLRDRSLDEPSKGPKND